MAKLRNAHTDVGAMAQYLARKCVIHSPQAELDLPAGEVRAKSPRFGKNADHFKGAEVHMIKTRGADAEAEPNTFVAISPKGRAIKVTVEEINPDELNPELYAAVGS